MLTEKDDQTEARRRRLHRVECKIRDLTVEIRHMADLIDQFRLDGKLEYVNSPQYSPNPPENKLVGPYIAGAEKHPEIAFSDSSLVPALPQVTDHCGHAINVSLSNSSSSHLISELTQELSSIVGKPSLKNISQVKNTEPSASAPKTRSIEHSSKS